MVFTFRGGGSVPRFRKFQTFFFSNEPFPKSKFKYFGNDAISEANVGGRNSDWSSDIVAASLAPFCLNVPGHDLSHASSHVKTTFGTKMQVLAEIVLLTGHGNQGVKIVLIPAIANNTS